jgi:hypothetical protein
MAGALGTDRGMTGLSNPVLMEEGVACLMTLVALVFAAGSTVPAIGGGSVATEAFNRTVSAAGVTAHDLRSVDGSCEARGSITAKREGRPRQRLLRIAL